MEHHATDQQFSECLAPFLLQMFSGALLAFLLYCVALAIGCLRWFHFPFSDRMLLHAARSRNHGSGGLGGWCNKDLPSLLYSKFTGLAAVLCKVEELDVWPNSHLDAHIAVRPKTEESAILLGQRPLSVVPFSASALGFG